MNVAAYWLSDKFAIKAARAKQVSEAEAPDLHQHRRRARAALRRAEAARLHDPVRAAERVRDRPQPGARGGRGHAGPAPVPAPRPGARRARARVRAHQEPRHPRLVDRGDDRRRDLGDREHLLLRRALRRGRRRQPARRDRRRCATIIIAPLAASLLQLAVSRQREYLADATAARMLGTGEPLAEALETLERGRQAVPMQVNPATEALYIVNPLKRVGVAALFSTHPPLEERIARLREYDRNRGHRLRTAGSCVRAAELRFGGADAGRSLRRDRPRALVVRARAARARADEARPPAPSVPRQVHPAARRDAARALRAGAAGACSTRSRAPGRRSSSRSRAATTRPASTSPPSTAC